MRRWLNTIRSGKADVRTIIPLAFGLAGAAIGGPVLGALIGAKMGAAAGYMAGALLGTMLFPQKLKTGDMPSLASYPVQRSNKGTPIPKTYGTVRVAGNILWMGENHPWVKKESTGGKGGSGGSQVVDQGNRRSFLIGICEGPATVIRMWMGKTGIDLSNATFFRGDGNTGINALTGESYSNYANLCCAFFNEFEIGSSTALPNFTFEVNGELLGYPNIIIAGNGVCQVLDGDYALLRTHVVAGASAIACDLAMDGRYVYTHGINLTGDPIITVRDRDGTDLGITFEEPTVFLTGFWSGVRFSPDGNFIYAVLNANGNDTLIKWNASTGTKIWERTPLGEESAAPTSNAPRHLEIDSDENCYVRKCWPKAPDPDKGKFAGFYDSDGDLQSGYLTVYEAFHSHVNEGLGYVYFSGGNTAFGEFDVLWAAELSTGIVTSQDFGNVAFNAFGHGITSNSDYVYAIFLLSGGDNIWQCSPDLQTIHNSVKITLAGGAVFHSLLINKQNQLVVIITGDGEAVTNANVIVFDENLTRITEYDVAGLTITSAFSPDSIQIPRPLLATVGTDENPALIIKDLLTNTRYGAGLDESTYIDSTSFDSVEDYCNDNDLLFSFVIDSQKPILDWIDFINSHFQGYLFMSEGKIHLGVFKSESSAFTLNQDNLVVEEGEDAAPPVSIKKRTYSETFNRVEISWKNRAKNYDTSIAIAQDEVDQRVNGKTRKRTIQLIGITNAALAQATAYKILFDSMYRFSIYNFTLSYKNMLLEVGDVGTLSDGHLITSQLIRLTSIEEDKDGRGLAIEAVEDKSHVYETFAYTTEDSSRVEDSAPTLASPSATFTEDLTESALAISIVPGGEETNGWHIYRSYDDESFELIGQANIVDVTDETTNSTGTISSNLPAHTAVAYAGDESFLVNIGTITDLDTAITDAAFFNNQRLCKIGNEIIAYKTCEETETTGVWRITGLIRGMFGTEAVAHTSGETFFTINNDFSYIYQDADIGRTLYFKFLTFHGNSIQTLASVSSVSYVISGKFKRPLPLSLLRIQDREGQSTYETDDVVVSFYFGSKTAGFNLGGHGDILWNAYEADPSIQTMNVILKETDDTEISNDNFDITDIGEPMAVLIEDADREGNNPFTVELKPGSAYSGIGSREIQLEQI